MSFLMGGQNSGLLSTSSTSKTSSNASKSRHKASFKISSVTLVAEELSASGMRTPRRLSSKLSSMVCVRVVVPFHWFGAISASMVATLDKKTVIKRRKLTCNLLCSPCWRQNKGRLLSLPSSLHKSCQQIPDQHPLSHCPPLFFSCTQQTWRKITTFPSK